MSSETVQVLMCKGRMIQRLVFTPALLKRGNADGENEDTWITYTNSSFSEFESVQASVCAKRVT